jgi:hypothetical protein
MGLVGTGPSNPDGSPSPGMGAETRVVIGSVLEHQP